MQDGGQKAIFQIQNSAIVYNGCLIMVLSKSKNVKEGVWWKTLIHRNREEELKSMNCELERLCIFSNYEKEWLEERIAEKLTEKYGPTDG